MYETIIESDVFNNKQYRLSLINGISIALINT